MYGDTCNCRKKNDELIEKDGTKKALIIILIQLFLLPTIGK